MWTQRRSGRGARQAQSRALVSALESSRGDRPARCGCPHLEAGLQGGARPRSNVGGHQQGVPLHRAAPCSMRDAQAARGDTAERGRAERGEGLVIFRQCKDSVRSKRALQFRLAPPHKSRHAQKAHQAQRSPSQHRARAGAGRARRAPAPRWPSHSSRWCPGLCTHNRFGGGKQCVNRGGAAAPCWTSHMPRRALQPTHTHKPTRAAGRAGLEDSVAVAGVDVRKQVALGACGGGRVRGQRAGGFGLARGNATRVVPP